MFSAAELAATWAPWAPTIMAAPVLTSLEWSGSIATPAASLLGQGSWPDSHRVVAAVPVVGGWASPNIDREAARAGTGAIGITESSRECLFAGSPAPSIMSTSAISHLAATCVAFNLRCTPSLAQVPALSTVVRY